MSFDIGEDLSRTRSKYGIDFLQKIFTRLASLSQQDVLDELIQRTVPHDDLILLTDLVEGPLTNITTGDMDEPDLAMDASLQRLVTRFIPTDVSKFKVNSITPTIQGTWSFPQTGMKFGARASFNATQYLKLSPYNSSTQMDIGTGPFGIILWCKNIPASGDFAIFCKRNVINNTNAGIQVLVTDGEIRCRVSDNTNTALLQAAPSGFDLSEDVWHSVCINVPSSGNLECLVDKVSRGTVSRGSVGSLNNSRDAYVGVLDSNGTTIQDFTGDIAWLNCKKSIFTTAQIAKFHDDGVLDCSEDDSEIVDLPLVSDALPRPYADLGGFPV